MLGRAQEHGRSDDTLDTIQQRLRVYREQTAPLIDYYGEKGVLQDIAATGTVREIAARVQEVLDG